MDDFPPLLTLSQLQGWEVRRAEIARLLVSLTEEDAVLARKLDAAKVFLEDVAPFVVNPPGMSQGVGDSYPGAEIPSDDPQDESIAHAVLAAVEAMNGTPKPAAIRKWIEANNPEMAARLNAHPGYLYTSLMRHVRARRLVKFRKGYRLPPVPQQGKAGGTATPPGGLLSSTLSDKHAATNGMEAGGT